MSEGARFRLHDGYAEGTVLRLREDGAWEIQWDTGARCAVPADWGAHPDVARPPKPPPDPEAVLAYESADLLIERARLERCNLPYFWKQAAGFSFADQLRVADALEAIEPLRAPGSGYAVEPRWTRGRGAKKRLREARERETGEAL